MLNETQAEVFYPIMTAAGCTPDDLKAKVFEANEENVGKDHAQLVQEFVQEIATSTINDLISSGDIPEGSTVKVTIEHDYLISYVHDNP